jgi:hypothetical protein
MTIVRELIAMQMERFRCLDEILPANRFTPASSPRPVSIRGRFDHSTTQRLPLITCPLAADRPDRTAVRHRPDLPRSRYVRLHQTSGTAGPLRWLDTPSWQWMLDCWQLIYDDSRRHHG